MFNVKVLQSTKRAKGYNSMPIEFLGEVHLDVDYNGNKFVHTF